MNRRIVIYRVFAVVLTTILIGLPKNKAAALHPRDESRTLSGSTKPRLSPGIADYSRRVDGVIELY